jgi:hypothetical protein
VYPEFVASVAARGGMLGERLRTEADTDGYARAA